MIGLPKTTELNRQLPKNAIYAKFQMNTAEKERIDRDISRIYIVNEISAAKVNLKEGAEVKSFFVMSVLLKRKDFDEKNIITLSKLIPQNIVMVLEYEGEAKLVTYRNKLLQTMWMPKGKLSIEMKGLDLDAAWENIIIQIGGLTIEQGRTLDEQISIDGQRAKLQKKIDRLEKLARTEKQPKKKFELAQQVSKLKKQMEGVL